MIKKSQMAGLINSMNKNILIHFFFARKVSQHMINSIYDQQWAIATL
jgi:hypothetical protein